MKSVKRLNEPQSLKQNAAVWTQELLNEIARLGNYSKVSDSFKGKYNQIDVKTELAKMYNNRCCYCEGALGEQTYGRIEHLKPKSLPQFYDLTFVWDNLHWSCEICNTNKGKKWNSKFPILDPTKDNIDDHIRLNVDSGEYEIINGSRRGETTIEHTQMNRCKLVEARQKVAFRIKKNFLRKDEKDRKKYLEETLADAEEFRYPCVVMETCNLLEQLLRG